MKQLFVLLLFILFVGCTKLLSTEEYIKTANSIDGPLSVQVEQGGYTFNCFYRPTDYYIAHIASFEKKSPKEVQDEVQKQYEGGTYFIVTINSEKYNPNLKLFGQNFNGQGAMNLLYGLSPNFNLVTSKDIVKCEVANINRSWGNSEEVALLLVFPKVAEKKLRNYQLKIQDFGLDCGTVMVPLKKINPKKIALQF